jgi:hypothetical protein
MSNHELEIIMKLKDEVSRRIASIEGALQKFANQVKETGVHIKQFGRDLSQVGNTISFLGAAITGPLILAFKSAAKYSADVQKETNNLQATFNTFQVSIAQALVPVIQQLNTILGNLLRMWESLGPAQQQMIVQAVFMGGMFLIIGGIVTSLTGKLISMTGSIFKIISAIMTFALANPVLAGIAIAIGILIFIFLKFEGVATKTLNAIEIAVRMVQIGFLKLVEGITWALDKIVLGLQKFYEILGKLPGGIGGIYRAAATECEKFRGTLSNVMQGAELDINKSTEKMAQALGGEGELAKGFEDLKSKISGVFSGLQQPLGGGFFDNLQKNLNAGAGDTYVQDYIRKQEETIAQSRAMWDAWNNEKLGKELARLQSETEFLQVALETQKQAHMSMWTMVGQARDAFAQGISQLVMDMINGVANAKEFFKKLGMQMIQILVAWSIQKMIAFALSKILQAGEVAVALITGSAIASAWAPAAAMVSLATCGANAIPASAGIETTVGIAQALAIPGAEQGALIKGSKYGSLVIAGENYKKEAIVPLENSKFGRNISGGPNIINIEIANYNPVVLSEEGLDKFANTMARKVSDIFNEEINRI